MCSNWFKYKQSQRDYIQWGKWLPFEIKNSQLLNKFDLISQNDDVLSQVSKEAHNFIKNTFSLSKSVESFYKDFEKTLSK